MLTQHPVHSVKGIISFSSSGRFIKQSTHLHLASWLIISGTYVHLPMCILSRPMIILSFLSTSNYCTLSYLPNFKSFIYELFYKTKIIRKRYIWLWLLLGVEIKLPASTLNLAVDRFASSLTITCFLDIGHCLLFNKEGGLLRTGLFLSSVGKVGTHLLNCVRLKEPFLITG